MDPSAKTILVVDDDPDVRELSVIFLGEFGYKVLEAGDGQEGLKLLREHPEIDLLFTDIVMPRLDGVTLAHLAKELRPALRVIYVSGFAERVRELRGEPLHGMILPKPFRRRQLASAVESELSRAEEHG
jgi:CheY-like chemotaxis protein